jgi:hypothetical protein
MKLPSIVAFVILALAAPVASLIHSPPAEARSYHWCGVSSYINVRGHCVHRPVHASRAPIGASARCRDGTYSFSENHRGTCSWHGGVAQWL